MPKSSYFVLNGHTLGYTREDNPGWFHILHGSVLKGGHDPKRGPTVLAPTDELKPATLEDFEEFRVSPKGHIA